MRRSQLYVPGNNEKMIIKSTQLDADSIVLDLEDAVPIKQKESARELVKKLISELDWGNKELSIRINSPSNSEGIKDLAFIKDLEKVSLIVVPKAEYDISFIYRALGINLEPIIETAKGVLKVEDIVTSEGVVAITWGPADLALSIAGDSKIYQGNDIIRIPIVMSAKSYGIDPLDSVFFDLNDTKGFEEECKRAKMLGFVGKQLIHPSQIPIANSIFSPSKEEVEKARKIVQAYEEAAKQGKGAIRFEGQLIDNVHYMTAKKLLEKLGDKQ